MEDTSMERSTMYFQIFGLRSHPEWWFLSRLPAGGGAELARMLHTELQASTKLSFYCYGRLLDEYEQEELLELWAVRPALILAKPATATRTSSTETRLRLVTTAGPDTGRIFPLTRQPLSVGRGASRAQVRDPWLSDQDFDIRLATQGVLVTRVNETSQTWEYGETFVRGTTGFDLLRGSGNPISAPQDPGDFAIAPGPPPSPPNLVLQIIGAAAPLIIGVVLMLVTGMWYFLLFSGISVIIAAVLLTQYRRVKTQYFTDILAELETTAKRFRKTVFTPDKLMTAISSQSIDPLDLGGPQPNDPIINVGPGIRQAELIQVQDDPRWQDALLHQADSILPLKPGEQTIVVGDPASIRPLKYWITAQLLRHIKATGTGLLLGNTHIGGAPVVEVVEDTTPVPESNLHQLIFTTTDAAATLRSTTVIRLDQRTIEGRFSVTSLEPFGISFNTLQLLADVLLLNQPARRGQLEHLHFSSQPMRESATDQLITTLGTGDLGLSVDIVSQGPHMLITGSTGSGKSELLLTVLIGFAQRYSPCEMSFVLLDFKGGSSFNVLAPLPHTMSVETNHVAATSLRSLEAIAAELYRREALFAEKEVADFEAYRRRFPHETLPRLVVAIDELRVLVDQNSQAPATLAHLAATGRSLGFHLIVATQRTQGAVSADIRANIGCIIALRTSTEHDSWDVIGTGDAYRISPNCPGRAYFKSGAESPREFQTARYVLDQEPIVLAPHTDPRIEEIDATTDWTRVVNKLSDTAKLLPRPVPIILPALEPVVTISALHDNYGLSDAYLPVGLVDDPANCLQYPVVLGPVSDIEQGLVLSSSVAWIGAPDSGLEACLWALAEHLVLSTRYLVYLDGQQLSHVPTGWDQHLKISEATPDMLKNMLEALSSRLSAGLPTTLVITEWGSWANALVTGSFQGFEERLIELLRQFSSVLTLYVFGARELAGGRLLAMIPERFYIPKNSSAEHQLIWPKLRQIPPVTARGVLVTSEQASGGLEVQLCTH